MRRKHRAVEPVAVFTAQEVLRLLMRTHPHRFAEAGFAEQGTADMYLDSTGVLRVIQTRDDTE